MIIHTAETFEKQRKKDARRLRAIQKVLRYMRAGQSLHQHRDQQGQRWTLSNGAYVSADIAAAVTNHNDIVACGDCLFRGGPSQTFRYADSARW